MRRFCAALLLASIASAASAAPQTLAGRVLDAQGAPIAGAEVMAYFKLYVPDPHQMRFERADGAVVGADGRFAIELSLPLDCNEAVVIARKGGLAPSWATFYLSPWRANGSKDITLEASASIAGTVSDEAGNPIPGAEVTADVYLTPENGRVERRITGGPPLDWLRTKTDARGCFTIKDLPKTSSADLHVTASGKGGLFLEKPGKVVGAFDAGAADIRVTLQPEARIQGTVVDGDTQKPLAGVPVLVVANSTTVETDAQVRVTGPDGAFEASGLPAADYTISLARFPDQTPAALANPLAVKDVRTGEVRKEVVLPTSPSGLLEVFVANVKKEPISDARVSVQALRGGDSQQGQPTVSAFSGKDGIAAFRLPPGDYRIFPVEHELYFQQSNGPPDTLNVEKGKTLRVDLTVAEKPHASGVVLDPQGKPVAGAAVTVFPFASIGGATTDKDGKFEVRWVTWGGSNGISASLLVRKPEADLAGMLSLEDQGRMENLKITLAPGMTITGTVVDPDNKPISKANVQVFLEQSGAGYSCSMTVPEQISTGQDGKYAIHALPADQNYKVTAQASGFGKKQSPADLAAAKDRAVELEPIMLKRANLTVTGIVVDEDDKPVSGAQIDAWGDEQNVPNVQSDKDGKFTLKNLCDAEAMIRAWKQVGGQNQQGSVNYSSDMKEVKITLGENAQQQAQGVESVRASGVVLDAQGQPVAGATVQAMPSGSETRKTDQDGKFKVSWQRWPGQQQIQSCLLVRAPKADLAAVFSLEDADKLDDLKITLAPGITITGTVVDPDNKPIPKADVQVNLQQNNFNASLQEQVRTGQDGKYTIHALPADQTFQVTAAASGFGQKRSPVDLTTAKDRAVEMDPIVLKRANLTVTGIVVDEDDKPVSGAQINVWGDEQNARNGQYYSGKDGKFTLKNLCDAEAMIRAWKLVDGQQEQGSVNYSADMEEVKIVLGENAQEQAQGAQILRASGVVLDAQGQPVAGATVQAMPFGNEPRKTDKDGKFKVSWQLWPGQQQIQGCLLVRAPKADLAAVFSLADVDKPDDLKITLAPGITITGTVVDPDNKPIPKADVEVNLQQNSFNSSFTSSLQEQIRTGQDGKYTIHALPADQTFQVTAQASGFGQKRSPVDLTEAKDHAVELEPIMLKRANLTVTGIVVDEDDKPVSGAQINVWGDEQNARNGQYYSGKDGKFTLKNLCDAEATIRAWKQIGNQNLQGSIIYSSDMKEVKIVMGLNADQSRPVVSAPPVPAEQLFAEGQKAMDEQNWTEAVARFKELAEKYPNHALTPDALTAAIAICENRLNDQKTADELRKKEAALKQKQ